MRSKFSVQSCAVCDSPWVKIYCIQGKKREKFSSVERFSTKVPPPKRQMLTCFWAKLAALLACHPRREALVCTAGAWQLFWLRTQPLETWDGMGKVECVHVTSPDKGIFFSRRACKMWQQLGILTNKVTEAEWVFIDVILLIYAAVKGGGGVLMWGRERERRKSRGQTQCLAKYGRANGSRKRILILILHTQILLYSPSGSSFSTLRRQKARRLSGFWPQQTPFLRRSGFSPERVKLWLAETSANCSPGGGDGGGPPRPRCVRKEEARHLCQIFFFCYIFLADEFLLFWGKTERRACAEAALRWELSINFFGYF